MRICCVLASLKAGGSERVMSLLANAWCAGGHAVSVVTMSDAQSDAFALDSRVTRIGLSVEKSSRSLVEALLQNASKIHHLRKGLQHLRPDVVISFGDRVNVLALISSLGLRVPTVISERVHPDFSPIGAYWGLLRRLTYLRASALVVQASDIRAWAERRVPTRAVHVVANPVAPEFAAETPPEDGERLPVILGVGRLVAQKGFDLLIKAFGQVVRRNPGWTLSIVGEGPLEGELRQLAREHIPDGAVDFHRVTRDLRPIYRRARIFVAPSRFEGFPNTVLEAMASGCAVIGSRCAGAMAEIVQHGVNGLLVAPDDVPGLVAMVERLVTGEGERTALARRAIEVRERFSLTVIAGQWVEIAEGARPTVHSQSLPSD